jgi:hypothetical protein
MALLPSPADGWIAEARYQRVINGDLSCVGAERNAVVGIRSTIVLNARRHRSGENTL